MELIIPQCQTKIIEHLGGAGVAQNREQNRTKQNCMCMMYVPWFKISE